MNGNTMNLTQKTLANTFALLAIGIAPVVAAADDKPAQESFLFVQHAESASLDDGTLTLRHADANMIVFADRPHRVAGVVPTSNLVEFWGDGQDSFADEPPNAALVGQSEGKPVSMVVELSNPRLAGENLTISYKILEGTEIQSLEMSYLVIDSLFFKIDGVMNLGAIASGDAAAAGRCCITHT